VLTSQQFRVRPISPQLSINGGHQIIGIITQIHGLFPERSSGKLSFMVDAGSASIASDFSARPASGAWAPSPALCSPLRTRSIATALLAASRIGGCLSHAHKADVAATMRKVAARIE
jgi:hypothetical protein